ncbi:MAG TPA: FAD-dependent oxidoreductase, partial [Paenalcaligenes sp.]|nr:FAD-dependent oxidoreductase [Paenalcaligenes sp.]
VPSVRAARERGVLQSRGPLAQLTATTAVWPDGSAQDIDAIIWCTGFRPALQPLTSMGLVQEDGKIQVQGTQATAAPGLWLVGYGEWTGMASATLVGVMRTARSTAQEIDAYLADFI